ncbi:unnamed protein product [Allacma fusca]|uniref:Protein kinase domain-containing protein n=1 Tax=Allacma fusca TaxID=39272 RepID=A0A8J2PU09_9HEXA|nr:unnamed protein product [Allacma fusca]
MGNSSLKIKDPNTATPMIIKQWMERAKNEFEERWNNTKSGSTSTLEDFDLLKTLGSGSFGRVMIFTKVSSQVL